MKKTVSLLLALLFCCFAFCVSTGAAEPLLHDEANLLSEQNQKKLTALLEEKSQESGITIAVLTVQTMDGKSAMDYADDYYDAHYLPNDGILLLVCMGTRDYYETTYGDCIGYFDGYDRRLEDTFVTDLSNGSYYSAFVNFATAAAKRAEYMQMSRGNQLASQFGEDISGLIFIALIIGLIIALIMTSLEKAKLKSVKKQQNASQYVRKDSMHLRNSRDLFLYSHTTRTRVSSSSSGGGRSSGGTHMSSGGHSHGGHGGKF